MAESNLPKEAQNPNAATTVEQKTDAAKEKLNIEEKKAVPTTARMPVSNEMSGQAKMITGPSTQEYLDIEEIHNGVAILKNSGMRMILMVSAINFSLKSEAEQNSIIYSFQNFLNSLTFPIQVVMQSRRLDLSAYIGKLRAKEKKAENPLLRLQMTDYIAFVEQLLKIANIMEKKFYIVIPYQPIVLKKEGIFTKLINLFSKSRKTEILDFEIHRKELAHRTEVVASALGSMGLRAIQLDTHELAELYYSSYNPEMAARQKLYSLAEITTPIVESAPKKENQ